MASLERSDLSVYIAAQAAEGTVNVSPAFKIIRGTSGIVQSTPTYVTSNEVITDGQAAQQVQDRRESTLTREFDVTKETISLFNEVIHGTQSDNSSVASTAIAATATGFTVPTATATKLSVGDWFGMSGFADESLNIRYKVASKTATTLTTTEAPSTTESAGASVVLTSLKASSDQTKTLRTIQNRITDLSKTGDINYETYLDCFASVGSLTVDKSSIVTGSMEFKIPTPLDGTAAIAGQTDLAKDDSPVVSAVNNIGAFYENGINSKCNIQTMSIEFNNNYEGDGGAAGCIDEKFGRGAITVSGSITARTVKANSSIWRDKNRNGTTQALAIEFKWGDEWAIMEVTNALISSHEFTDGDIVVANSMEYSASGADETGKTFQIFSSF